jgi:diguanylate cyclase (GGDEF)-like protein
MAEDRRKGRKASAPASAHRAQRRVNLYVWGFRGIISLLVLWGLAFVLVVPRDDTPLDYALTSAAFLIPLSIGLVMAAIASSMQVGLERGMRGQPAARRVQLEDIAMRDEVTQIFNRRYFYQRFQQEMEKAQGLGRPLGLVLLDVDDLKTINDTFGHRGGDEVLAAVGRILVEETRGGDVPARVGGDEFAVLMPEADKRGMSAATRRIQGALEAATVYESSGASLKPQVSLGASGYPWGGSNVDEVMHSAESELSAAKAARREQPAAVETEVQCPVRKGT